MLKGPCGRLLYGYNAGLTMNFLLTDGMLTCFLFVSLIFTLFSSVGKFSGTLVIGFIVINGERIL
jgi:hypothetical protein